MTVYLIAEIKVTDDKWVPDYAANVHPLVKSTAEVLITKCEYQNFGGRG